MPKYHQRAVNITMIFIVIMLFLIVLVLLIFYGPRWVVFHDGNINQPYEVDRSHGWGVPDVVVE